MRISQLIRRQWITLVIITLICCVYGVSVVLHSLGVSGQQRLSSAGKAYDFSLVNSTGHPVALHDSAGKVRLVAFIYTRCNASCPVVTSQMVQLQNDLKRQGVFGNSVEFMSVTMDPTYDTGSVFGSYANKFGVSQSGWEFLTGTPQTIDNTLKQYGVYVKKIDATQYVHTTAEFLIDRQGNIRKIYGADISAQDSEKDIETVLRNG